MCRWEMVSHAAADEAKLTEMEQTRLFKCQEAKINRQFESK